MATRIGCDNLVYAIMTEEETVTTPPVYDTVKQAPGVMSLNITPNSSQETLFADDGPMESASTLGAIDVEIQKNSLTSENKADLLGHKIDVNGGVVYSSNDVPPYVAVGFRTLKSNGKYRYVWLYKGKFSEPEDNNETKGDTVNFQADTISGQFSKLKYAVKIDDEDKYPWKYEIDGDHEGVSEAAMKNWFAKPHLPGVAITAG